MLIRVGRDELYMSISQEDSTFLVLSEMFARMLARPT